MPEQLNVTGRVSDPDKKPLIGLTVKAFDKDLPSLHKDQLLGEDNSPSVTNSDGYYRIEFGQNDFRDFENRSPDLYIEVYDGNTVLGRSAVRYNAGTETTIDLTVKPLEKPEPTEYETLVSTLSPLIGPLSLANLTKEDVDFLTQETGRQAKFIEWIRSAAQLAGETGVRAEAFYGWARSDETASPLDRIGGFFSELVHGDDALPGLWKQLPEAAEGDAHGELIQSILKCLKKSSDDHLRAALLEAVDRKIVPIWLKAQAEDVIRKLKTYGEVAYRVSGRVVDAETDDPLENVGVRVHDAQNERPLVTVKTNPEGAFSFAYIGTRERTLQPNPEPRLFRLEFQVPGQKQAFTQDIQIKPGQDKLDDIRLTLIHEPPAEPTSPPVQEVVEASGVELSRHLENALTEHGIHTLADVRRLGGLSKLGALQDSDQKAVTALEFHAQLNLLSDDFAANQYLIDQGYTSIAAVARVPRPQFVKLTHGTLGDAGAALLHVQATAQLSVAMNIATGQIVDFRNGLIDANNNEVDDGS